MKTIPAAITGFLISSLSIVVSGKCLDFVDFRTYKTHTCYRGAFTCLGKVDENCHIGENQLLLDVLDEGNIVGFKFENEGPQNSMIETIWIEDDFNLLKGHYPPAPISNHGGTKFRTISNETNFNAANAHGVNFEQHFVISEVDQNTKLRSRLSKDKVDGVWNSGHTNKHNYVSMNFETECSASEIRTAIEYGMIRIGIQASQFDKKPLHKGYVSCWERLKVIYDEELKSE